jgi:predicted transcriptional regulator
VPRKRVDIQIMGDILRLQEGGKTEIAFCANLGYLQLESYLSLLVDKGFIEEDNHLRTAIFHVTPQGQELLRSIERVTEALGFEELDGDH